MKKIICCMILSVCLLTGLLAVTTGTFSLAAVDGSAEGTFQEKKCNKGALEISNLVAKTNGVVAYYKDEDGINQKAVYNSKKNSWVSKPAKDTEMKAKGKTTYYDIFAAKTGYIEVAPNSSKVVLRSEKGKKQKEWNMKNIRGWNGKNKVVDVLDAGNNRFLFVCKNSEKSKSSMVCVDLKKSKVKWTIKKFDQDALCLVKNQLYSYSYRSNKVGNPSKQSDDVNVYRLKDGKKSSSIDATPLRNLVKQLKGQQTNDAYPITDQKIAFSSCKGNLYAAYMSGIYVYQQKSKSWKCVVDGTKKEQYSPAKDMTIVDLLVVSKKEMYVLASKGNYDGETTDFIQYKQK